MTRTFERMPCTRFVRKPACASAAATASAAFSAFSIQVGLTCGSASTTTSTRSFAAASLPRNGAPSGAGAV